MRAQVKKISDLSCFNEKEIRSFQDTCQQFAGNIAKKKVSTREEQLSVATNISQIKTIGLATELTFKCDCCCHFKDKHLRYHIASIIPTRISDRNIVFTQVTSSTTSQFWLFTTWAMTHTTYSNLLRG